jgi:hypothetical protein
MSSATTLSSPQVAELAVAAAWNRYLVDTKAAAPGCYEVVEEEAWCALERRLRVIGHPLSSR